MWDILHPSPSILHLQLQWLCASEDLHKMAVDLKVARAFRLA